MVVSLFGEFGDSVRLPTLAAVRLTAERVVAVTTVMVVEATAASRVAGTVAMETAAAGWAVAGADEVMWVMAAALTWMVDRHCQIARALGRQRERPQPRTLRTLAANRL